MMQWRQAAVGRRAAHVGVLLTIVLAASAASSQAQQQVKRAYELVSPAQKAGYQIGRNVSPASEVSVSPDGARLTYTAAYPLPGTRSGAQTGLMATRNSSGWDNRGLTPGPGPNQVGWGLPGLDVSLRGSTPDGLVSTYFDNSTDPYGSLWVRRTDGTASRIADASDVGLAEGVGDAPGQPWFAGMSIDGRHVVFASTDALVPGVVPTGSAILYEWVDDGSNGGQGTLRVVNRVNGDPLTLIGSSEAQLGASASSWVARSVGGRTSGTRNAVSVDGSRIFFQTPAGQADGVGELLGGGPVYARINGQETVEMSAPASGHAPTRVPTLYRYLDAARSGARAFFWADGDLTADAPADGGIYAYDTVARELRFLAPAQPVAGFPPTAMTSDDGHRLYYQDGDDIYGYWSGRSTLILGGARIEGDSPTSIGIIIPTVGIRDERCTSANVSTDGRFFAFSARRTDENLDVYLYDAESGRAPQNVSNSAPHDSGFTSAGSCGVRYPRQVKGRVMSNDGGTIFFDTIAPLVPGDNNGEFDAYEWHNGVLGLISGGTGPNGSFMVGTDESGTNAFFVTTDALVEADPDTAYDIYTARIGGGFASDPGLPPCDGDQCQGPAPGQPPTTTPGTTTYRGTGNLDATPEQRSEGMSGFALRRVSSAAARKLVRRGTLTVSFTTRSTGTVQGSLSLRIARRWRVVATARAAATRGDRGTLRFILPTKVRARLAGMKTKTAALVTATLGRRYEPQRIRFQLPSARSASNSRGVS